MARKPEPVAGGIGWKWLAGILLAVVGFGGAAWMTTVSSDGRDLRDQVAQVKKEIGDKATDIKVLQKDVEAIRDSQKRTEDAIRESQKEQRDSVKELKQLLEQERFGRRPRAN